MQFQMQQLCDLPAEKCFLLIFLKKHYVALSLNKNYYNLITMKIISFDTNDDIVLFCCINISQHIKTVRCYIA